jgi:hypothetical protein
LKKKHVSLKEIYEELKTSHENLLDTHEKLKKAHNSHISQEANNCDLLDDMPNIDKLSKSRISTSCDDLLAMSCSSNVDSFMNGYSSCDSIFIVENHELTNIVDCLTKAPLNCHSGENTYNKIWEYERFTLKHEGLGYIHKKNKSVFVNKKITFMKECGLYCSKCKNIGYLNKDCTGSKIMHASIDSSYALVKSSRGDIYAKFIRKNRNHTYIFNNDIVTKKKSIWVSKVLVTNIKGPKQVWVLDSGYT